MTSPPAPMDRSCPVCNAATLPAWRHCASCGTQLLHDDRPEQARVVTMVISDLQGSTALAETLDPESLRLVLDRYFDELGVVFESHGGHIEKRIGDAMVTAFGFPVAHPDDPLRALRATIEGQESLANLNEHLHAGWGVRLVNRTGIATGTIVYAQATGAHRVLAGDAFDLSGGLEPLAPPLEALVSAETARLVGDAATFGPMQHLTLKSGREVDACQLLTATMADESATDKNPTSPNDTCGGCGEPRDPAHTWCTSCGLPVVKAQRRVESRRTLTVVFADLTVQHTRDGVTDSDERAAMLRVFDVARAVLERHDGVVENFIGDAVMAIYGLRQRNEDDALRAVKAAVEMQERLAALAPGLDADMGVRLVVKIGVNTGAVIAGDPSAGERLVTGDAVNVAARLEQTADPGNVVIGGLTRTLAGHTVVVEEMAPLTLKGKTDPVPAFRVVGIESSAKVRRNFELPFLGRDEHVDALRTAWESALAKRQWQRIAVVGDAGTGKSRLVHELLDALPSQPLVLRGACLPYGEGITFWPIGEIVRAAAGINAAGDADASRAAIAAIAPDDEVAVRLQSLLGLLDDRAVPVAELVWATRRLLSHLASNQPLVVVVDGMQWAEPTLRDLLAEVVADTADSPALLITMERPVQVDEGLDDAAADSAIGENAPAGDPMRVWLEPLEEQLCDDLLVGALGPDALPASLRERIVRASGGIPLFVEQMLTMLIGDGRLVRDGEVWRSTRDIEDLAVPPTIEALLAARLDALTDAERAVLQPASVVGRSFSGDAVEHLDPTVEAGPPLTALTRRQLVTPLKGNDPLADHRFANLMTRDVVYDGLLKRTRSQLHQRVADWMLQGPASGRLTEVEEILGYHLERAFLLGAEVATVDDGLIEVGVRAATHLGAAGERAYARGDMPAAANLLQRAAHTLHHGGPRAAELLIMAGDAVMETGDFPLANVLFDRAEATAEASGHRALVAAAQLARCTMAYLTGGGVDDETARATAEELRVVFEAEGDHAGVARCWRLITNVDLTAFRWGAAEQAAISTIEFAQRARNRGLELRMIPALANFAVYGPTPVPLALERCEQLLADAGANVRARALIQQCIAHLLALDGRVDEARALCTQARQRLVEFGWNFDAALVSIHLGPIEMSAGDPAAAEAALRADYEILRDMGEQNYLSTTVAFLAEAVRRQGRPEEADALAAEAMEMAAPDDVSAQGAWRVARLRLLADEHRLDEARSVAQEALELMLATEAPQWQALALLDVADIQARRGDVAAAQSLSTRAKDLFDAKGDRMGSARAQRLIDQLSGPAAAT